MSLLLFSFISNQRRNLSISSRQAWGLLFEDFTRTQIYAMCAFLLHRTAVGALIGATVLPSRAEAERQIAMLVAVFFALFAYIVYCRPFLQRLANVCEALVVLCQGVCVFFNLFLLDEGGRTLLGMTLTPAEALSHMHWLMIASMIFMLLRFCVVMMPTPVVILQSTFPGWTP